MQTYKAQLALLYVYGVGALAYLVLIQNAYPVESYFRVIPHGSVAYSLRYASFQWTLTLLATFKLLAFPALCTSLLYRRNRACVAVWAIVLALVACTDLVTVLGLGRFYSACNESGQVDNPCNDRRWCCLASIYGVVTNQCPRSTPCTPPVTELRPDADFLWTFYANLAFLLLDILILLIWQNAPAPTAASNDEEQSFATRVPEKRPPSEVAPVVPIVAPLKWTKGE
jgi:hypothetical protein